MNKSRSWGRMIPHFSTHPNHKKDDEICLLRPFHSIKMMILIPIWPKRLSIIVSNMGIIYQIYQIWAYSNPYNLYLNKYCIYIYIIVGLSAFRPHPLVIPQPIGTQVHISVAAGHLCCGVCALGDLESAWLEALCPVGPQCVLELLTSYHRKIVGD